VYDGTGRRGDFRVTSDDQRCVSQCIVQRAQPAREYFTPQSDAENRPPKISLLSSVSAASAALWSNLREPSATPNAVDLALVGAEDLMGGDRARWEVRRWNAGAPFSLYVASWARVVATLDTISSTRLRISGCLPVMPETISEKATGDEPSGRKA